MTSSWWAQASSAYRWRGKSDESIPAASIVVIERENEVAAHQSSHNSGVIHSGIYYRPGSLKARLCVEGAAQMYDFCDQHAIPTRRCGKLIIARSTDEVKRLDELERRGWANGVAGLSPASTSSAIRTSTK